MSEKRRGGPGRPSWVAREDRVVGKNLSLAPRQIAWLKAQSVVRHVPESLLVREALDEAMREGSVYQERYRAAQRIALAEALNRECRDATQAFRDAVKNLENAQKRLREVMDQITHWWEEEE